MCCVVDFFVLTVEDDVRLHYTVERFGIGCPQGITTETHQYHGHTHS